MAVSSPPTFGAATNPAAGSVRKEFESLGSNTSLYAYRRGGGIVPDTSYYSGIGLGTSGSPLQLTQFAGLTAAINFQGQVDGYVADGAAAADTSGNIYMSVVEFDSALNYVSFNMIKLSTTGSVLWKKKYTSSSLTVYPRTMLIDGSGNPYLIGYGSYPIGDGTYGSKLFIAKFNASTGGITWQKTITTTSADKQLTPRDAKIDPTGSYIFICGGDGLATMSTGQGFLCKMDLNGTLSWFKTNHTGYGYYAQQQYSPYQGLWWYNNPVGDEHTSIDFDTTNNRIICGQSWNSGPGIVAYDYSGNRLYAKRFTALSATQYSGDARVVVAGASYYLSCAMGYNNSDTDSNVYPYVVKINTDGTFNSILARSSENANTGYLTTQTDLITDGSYLYSMMHGWTLVKMNTAGTIQWKRAVSNSYGGYGTQNTLQGSTYINCSSYYMPGLYGSANTAIQYINKFPTDGSGTGTHGTFTYTTSSITLDTAGYFNTVIVYTGPVTQSWPAVNGDLTLVGDSTLTLTMSNF